MNTSLLSTLHRALITLSALHLGQGPRKVVLAKNQVTEADLRQYYEQWQHLQIVHQAKQARYEPKSLVVGPEATTTPATAEVISTH